MKKCLMVVWACFVSGVVVLTGCKTEPTPTVETKPATVEETKGNEEAAKLPGS